MSRRATWPALGAALLLASACSTGPDYRRPGLPLPASWQTPPPQAVPGLADGAWWRNFGDPRLEHLIDEAIDANKDLRLAAQRVDQYEARLRGSESARYPSVGYAAGAGRELRSQERPNGLRPGQSPTLSDFELAGTVSWELDLWGRVRRSNEAALAELLGTQEARRGVMLTVVADVASGYLRLVELDRRLAIAREKLALRERAVALVDEKRKGGSATRLDVDSLRALAEAQAAEVPAIEREIASTELALCALLGRAPGTIERRSLEGLNLPGLPDGVPADVLTRRPDVAAAEQALVAANARVGVSRTAYFPTLSLTAAIGLAADDLRWLFAETARTGSLGAALAGTLFDGGRTEAEVREAQALRAQAETDFLEAVQTALIEVEDALAGRARADEREQAIVRHLQALERVQTLTAARVDGGQSGRLALFDAQIDLADARALQAEGRRDRLLALVAVYKAMGGGWMLEEERRRQVAATAAQGGAESASAGRGAK
ncbi:MAG: efflux transporter outer membrane subunit [Burkholderiales bacterium]|nr:efflux transporter outer membrane subunit [Burkholderiales bacterium]